MADPWRWWPGPDIARVTGCPLAAVTTNWPLIADALERRGIYDRDVGLGVLPTISIETASTFRPIHEYGTPADWAGYDGGPAYAGRGYIQLTHLSNYRAAGDALGLALAINPDLALDPHVAADVLAWYWATRGVTSKDGSRFWTLAELCHQHDWEWVRRVVQGGPAGLDRLIAQASALDSYAIPAEEPAVPTYNPVTPLILQNDDWSCFDTSLRMALESLGRSPSESWIESQSIADGVESTGQGLLDGSGAAGAAWITRQYSDPGEGTPTIHAESTASVSFDDVAQVAGTTAVLLGGHGWGPAGHWTFVRRYDQAADALVLGNPAGTYAGVGQAMSRRQFDQVGPCSMIVLLADGAVAPAPAPTLTYVQPGDVGSGLLAAMAAHGTEPAMASVFLPLGRSPAVVEECMAVSGEVFRWHIPTGKLFRYEPAA